MQGGLSSRVLRNSGVRVRCLEDMTSHLSGIEMMSSCELGDLAKQQTELRNTVSAFAQRLEVALDLPTSGAGAGGMGWAP